MGKTFPLGIDETIIFPLSQLEKRMPVIEAILSEFNSPESGQLKALNALFEYILVILIREAVRHEDINKGVLYAMLETPLTAALRAIHEEPEKNWGLDDLASLVNMSRTKFSVMFTSLVGVAPINYLTSWRIKLATEMLVKGLPINRVAISVGYSSQSAFARAFMREIGVTPKKWLLSQKQ
jgi:transcriptional regulator GlxA family with amidase domain